MFAIVRPQKQIAGFDVKDKPLLHGQTWPSYVLLCTLVVFDEDLVYESPRTSLIQDERLV